MILQLGMLQDAEDNYYITVKYLLELANRAYELFMRSEVEERRQLVKLVLSNLRVEGKTVRYEAINPFDTIISYADRQAWLRVTSLTQTLKDLFFKHSDLIKVLSQKLKIDTTKLLSATV